jgi:alkyl sulfatase BDS1-like metallo-beta-lactamase superfamily hydrolase
VAYGTIGIIAPNLLIEKPTQPTTLDGVNFVFYNVPGAECPAEMTFSIPDKKLYDGAENMSQQMHNLLPVRGAKVRDALRWSNYMDEALEQTKEPRSTSPPTTGRSGAMPASRNSSPCTATSTNTPTTRPCA